MYQKVFRRDEKKYLLTPAQYDKLFHKIAPHIQPDEYFEETICSLYFDTENRDLIIKSIDRPTYKQKIRLRSYNIPKLDDTVFLEIKNKYRGVVNKRRIKLKLSEFYDYYDRLHANKPAKLSAHQKQISRELDYLFKLYDLQPAWMIMYDRKSYCGRDGPYLRITIDKNLRSRTDDLKLEAGDQGELYFKDNRRVMEIKAMDSMPLWLVRALSELKIYPASFTKYGKIYENSKRRISC